jgi:hypothetical protein
MDRITRESGLRIYSMVLEYRNGSITHRMKESIMRASNMEKESLHGQMAQSTRATSKKI